MATLGKRLILLMLMVISLGACQKEFGPQSVNGSEVVPDSTLAIIVNEGNFQWGNASLGQFNPEEGIYQDGLFRQANAQPLGDVIQEAHKIGDRYYLVMNGSNELVICNADWTELKSSPGLGAPKNLWFWQGSLWMSDLYQPKLQELDLDGNLISNKSLSGIPNSLCSWRNQLLLVYPSQLESIVAPNAVPQELIRFNDNVRAVLNYQENLFIALDNGALYSWSHPDSNLSFVDSVNILNGALSSADGQKGFFSYDGDSLYHHQKTNHFKAKGIVRLSCENFYGLDFHAESKSLYLFDARAFVAPHKAWRINPFNAQVLNEFEAGALPNGLLRKW